MVSSASAQLQLAGQALVVSRPSPKVTALVRNAVLLVYFGMLATQGVPYGVLGDPPRYADMLNRHVQERESNNLTLLASFDKYRREPLFWLLSGDVIAKFLPAGFTGLNITLLSAGLVFLSFRLLVASFSQALLALVLFASTIQGFLVTFNLYRTALATFVFALCVWMLRRQADRRQRSRLAPVIASLAAALVHSVWVLQAVAFIKLPKKPLTFIGAGVALVGVFAYFVVGAGLLPLFEYFWARFQREGGETWRVPMASPVLIGLVLVTFLRRKRPIYDPHLYLRPLAILGGLLVCALVLRFSLAFERIYILATFLLIVFTITSSFATRREML